MMLLLNIQYVIYCLPVWWRQLCCVYGRNEISVISFG